MALVGPTLLTADPDTGNVASYATPSVGPTASSLVVVGVWNSDAANAIRPTLSSAFATGGWTDHGSAQNSTFVTRITLFSAVCTSSPGSGVITADFAADAQTGCIIIAVQYTGQDTTAPLIQPTIVGHSGAGVTSRTMTLTNPLGSAGNQMLSFIGHNTNEDQTAGGGATELASSDVGYATPANRMGVYHETNQNSHSASWATASVSNGASCEIVEAAAGAVVTPPPATVLLQAVHRSFNF